MPRKASDAETNGQMYRAPALEKGLDVLELLALEASPLSLSAIVQRLGRSTGELFRMIQVLERRGFVSQSADGYLLTTRLFEIGLGRPTVQNLVELALPVMRRLTSEVGQSCHLSLTLGGNMVVVARMESREQIGFSVRIGYHKPLQLTASGLILYSFQAPETRAAWETLFDPQLSKTALVAFRRRADKVRADRFLQLESNFAEGIVDLAAPILRGNHATAALCVPFFRVKGRQMPMDAVGARLREAALQLSAELVLNDNRV